MHFLVVDGRFGTPIYAFLEADPRGDRDFPGLAVRKVSVELAEAVAGVGPRVSVGRDPRRLDRFREFRSDGAVARAGFILIEPRYVGASWQEYVSEFRPAGEKPHKWPGRPRAAGAGVRASHRAQPLTGAGR
ncbi:MAG: hypothetical protein K2X82_27910 [Gemmataceae bacterium]|nr:hypothetical protein [Gemmataceae bacterium]